MLGWSGPQGFAVMEGSVNLNPGTGLPEEWRFPVPHRHYPPRTSFRWATT
jgi:hypothetical protein